MLRCVVPSVSTPHSPDNIHFRVAMLVSRLLRRPALRGLARLGGDLVRFEACPDLVTKMQARAASSSHMITADTDHSEVNKIPVQYDVPRQVTVDVNTIFEEKV